MLFLRPFWSTLLKIGILFYTYTSCLHILLCGFWVPGGQPWFLKHLTWAFRAAHSRLGCENNGDPYSSFPTSWHHVQGETVCCLLAWSHLIHSFSHVFALDRDKNLRPSSAENEVRKQKGSHLCFAPFFFSCGALWLHFTYFTHLVCLSASTRM